MVRARRSGYKDVLRMEFRQLPITPHGAFAHNEGLPQRTLLSYKMARRGCCPNQTTGCPEAGETNPLRRSNSTQVSGCSAQDHWLSGPSRELLLPLLRFRPPLLIYFMPLVYLLSSIHGPISYRWLVLNVFSWYKNILVTSIHLV